MFELKSNDINTNRHVEPHDQNRFNRPKATIEHFPIHPSDGHRPRPTVLISWIPSGGNVSIYFFIFYFFQRSP